MKHVELYGQVRYAVQIEGLSKRAAARRFGIDPEDGHQDDVVLGAAGLRAHEAAGAAEARSIHRDHRQDTGRRQKPAAEDSSIEVDLRAAPARRDRLQRRHDHREGLRGGLLQRSREMFVPLLHPPGTRRPTSAMQSR